MKKLAFLFSVVAVAFALQAGDSSCPKNKAACDKAKSAACDRAKSAACDKAKDGCCAKAEARGCCPSGAVKDTVKKPLRSPKDGSRS